MTTRLLLTLALVAAIAPAAVAQPAAPRGLVTVNGGYQSPSRTFSDSFTFEANLEDATVQTDYEVNGAAFFDGGFSVRFFGPIGAGVAFSRFSRTGTATIAGTIPHPFFFDRGRNISAEDDAKRHETAIHAQLVAYLPASDRLLIVLSAGPSFFNVEQGLVTAVTYDESYPFDEASLRRATVSLEHKRKVGFNAGADVTVRLGRSFGVGGMIRYAAATVGLAADARALKLDAGGLQIGGGVRFLF